MATTALEQRNGLTKAMQPTEKTVVYMPLGGKAQVELTFSMVRKFLCTPTKTGKQPSDAEVVKFMMLCRARELDPWVGDAFLTGYDTKDGPKFSLITAIQALLKRAEISPQFDGIEGGVVVQGQVGPDKRDGALILEGDRLLGAWSKCYRRDRKIPYYAEVNFSVFNTGYSRWEKDPAGMIVKCAKAAALREAFPTQLAGLYTEDEMGEISRERLEQRGSGGSQIAASALNDVISDSPSNQPQDEPEAINATPDKLTLSESWLADFGSTIDALVDADEVKRSREFNEQFCLTDADRKKLDEFTERRLTALKSKRGQRSNKPSEQGSLLQENQP